MMRYVYILAALLAAACSRNPVLREASALLENAPDSALTLLETLPREELTSEAEKAEYDYLSGTAFYKTYYFLDDSHAAALASAYHYRELQRNRISNVALLISAILATLVLYFWARNLQIQKQLLEEKEAGEKLLSTAEDLRSRLGALQMRQLKQASPGPMADIQMLDRLCEQYYVYEGTQNLQPRILSEVRSIVDGLRSDPAEQRRLEDSLNRAYDNVMVRLREAFPAWKEEDYLLYMFTASGFSSTTISTLLGKDKPYVYNRVYRLKERIKNSSAEGREQLLAALER